MCIKNCSEGQRGWMDGRMRYSHFMFLSGPSIFSPWSCTIHPLTKAEAHLSVRKQMSWGTWALHPQRPAPRFKFSLKCKSFKHDLYPSWWWMVEALRLGPEKPLRSARARPFPPPCSPAAGCVLVQEWRWTLLCSEACMGKKTKTEHSLSEWNRWNEQRGAVLLSLAGSDKIIDWGGKKQRDREGTKITCVRGSKVEVQISYWFT